MAARDHKNQAFDAGVQGILQEKAWNLHVVFFQMHPTNRQLAAKGFQLNPLYREFMRALFLVLVRSLRSNPEQQVVQSTFRVADTNGNGTLSRRAAVAQ